MSGDIATLGLAVDSRKVVTAEKDLKGFSNAAAQAELAARKVAAANDNVGASSGRLSRGLTHARGAVGEWVKDFALGALGAVGAAVAVERLIESAREAIKSVGEIGESARKIGLTSDEFQHLSFVAKIAIVDTGSFASSMKILAMHTSEANRNQGEFHDLLKANHISLINVNGQMKSQLEVLGIVAELYANATNEQDKLKIAQIAGGRSMNELANMLEGGAKGLEKAYANASETVGAFTDEQIAKMHEFDVALETVQARLSYGFKSAVVSASSSLVAFWEENKLAAGELIRIMGTAGTAAQAFYYGKAAGKAALAQHRANLMDTELTVSGSGKGSRYDKQPETVLPPDPAIQAALDAARKAAEAEAKRRHKQFTDTIADLKFEGNQLKSNALQQVINTELRKADVTATSAQGRAIVALATANFELAAAEKARLEFKKKWDEAQWTIIEEANKRLQEEAQKQQDELIQHMDDMRVIAKDIFSGIVSDARAGASALDILGNAMTKIENKILDLAENSLIDALFGKSGTSNAGGIGNFFSNFLSNLFGGGGAGGGLSGFYASGGPVSSGKSYMVGERGPERFTPSQSGMIAPNDNKPASIIFKPEIVIPPGYQARTENVSDGNGGNKPRVIIEQIGAELGSNHKARRSMGLSPLVRSYG